MGDRPTPDAIGWRLRLRDEHDDIVGAGILITPDRALTSAHVLPYPGAVLKVDYADYAGMAPSHARPVSGSVIPRSDDPPDGDVALLAVDPPRPRARPAPLRRIPRYTGLHVRMGGFPEDRDHGLWVRARVDGPYGAWMQLTPEDPAYVVDEGFSGTAVANAQLDRVSAEPPAEILGMVVSRFYDSYDNRAVPEFERRQAYMIPLDRIAELLPEVARLVGGQPPRDVSLTSRVPRPGSSVDIGFARRLTDWFTAAAGPRVELVAADPGSDRDLAFARELHRADVALDAGGRTPAELISRLLARLRLPDPYDGGVAAWLRTGGTRPALLDSGKELVLPLTVAVAGVDDAHDPAGTVALLRRLLALGGRLLVVFRREGGPSWAEAEDQLLYPALRAHSHVLVDRVIELERGRPGRRVATARIAARRALGHEPDRVRRLERQRALLEQLRADIARLEEGGT